MEGGVEALSRRCRGGVVRMEGLGEKKVGRMRIPWKKEGRAWVKQATLTNVPKRQRQTLHPQATSIVLQRLILDIHKDRHYSDILEYCSFSNITPSRGPNLRHLRRIKQGRALWSVIQKTPQINCRSSIRVD